MHEGEHESVHGVTCECQNRTTGVSDCHPNPNYPYHASSPPARVYWIHINIKGSNILSFSAYVYQFPAVNERRVPPHIIYYVPKSPQRNLPERDSARCVVGKSNVTTAYMNFTITGSIQSPIRDSVVRNCGHGDFGVRQRATGILPQTNFLLVLAFWHVHNMWDFDKRAPTGTEYVNTYSRPWSSRMVVL